MRILFLSSAFGLIVIMGGLTLWVIARTGLDIISISALLILTMLGLGLYGALRHPPE